VTRGNSPDIPSSISTSGQPSLSARHFVLDCPSHRRIQSGCVAGGKLRHTRPAIYNIISIMNDRSSEQPTKPNPPERSDSSSSSSFDTQDIHAPVPTRPRLLNRKSSGTLIVPRDSTEVGPLEYEYEADDVRAMSPRRTSEDLENLGREAREELHR